jgi:hypothetical protein
LRRGVYFCFVHNHRFRRQLADALDPRIASSPSTLPRTTTRGGLQNSQETNLATDGHRCTRIRKGLVFIRVHPCPSVANNVFSSARGLAHPDSKTSGVWRRLSEVRFERSLDLADKSACGDAFAATAGPSALSATSALSGFDFDFVFLSVSASLR